MARIEKTFWRLLRTAVGREHRRLWRIHKYTPNLMEDLTDIIVLKDQGLTSVKVLSENTRKANTIFENLYMATTSPSVNLVSEALRKDITFYEPLELLVQDETISLTSGLIRVNSTVEDVFDISAITSQLVYLSSELQ